MDKTYFLTVDWCNQGKRGIFCNSEGHCFRKDDKPHTEDEIWKILGLFDLILHPKSELLTTKQISEFNRWIPLEEYSNVFGIALKEQDVNE